MEDLKAIYYRGDIEVNFIGHILSEVLKEGVYRPYLPPSPQGKVCLDVGANIGLTSLYFSKYFEKVYSLEPSTEHFDTFTKMVEFNKLTNIKPINKALYIDNEKHAFGGRSDNKTMRSLHTAIWENGQPTEEVQCVTLDKLFEDEGITHIDLMKLDIEGSEIEVISSSSFREVADKIDVVCGESHGWSGRHPNQLKEAFVTRGFDFTVIPNDAQIWVARRKNV